MTLNETDWVLLRALSKVRGEKVVNTASVVIGQYMAQDTDEVRRAWQLARLMVEQERKVREIVDEAP